MSEKVPLCNDTNVQLRFLCPNDMPEVKRLCTEWFPIEYPDTWYEEITSNTKFFSLAAVFKCQIIGLIVSEIKPQTKCNKEDQGLLASSFPKRTEVAYILTLGVVREYRRNGIATMLLDNLIAHLTSGQGEKNGNTCKAIYLHVLTTNASAIQFYERRMFRKHNYLPLYYSVKGMGKDGYSYVLYINGGCPPFSVIDYMKSFGQLLMKYKLCSIPKRIYRQITFLLNKVWSGRVTMGILK